MIFKKNYSCLLIDVNKNYHINDLSITTHVNICNYYQQNGCIQFSNRGEYIIIKKKKCKS